MPVSFDPATARMRFVIGSDSSTATTTQDVLVRRYDSVRGIAYFVVPTNAVSGDVVVFSQVGNVQTFPADGGFPLQVVPVVTDVQVESVAADGSSAVVLVSGLGFTEGVGEYRFGDVVVVDAASNAGADVFSAGTRVRLTVALNTGNAFGTVSVKSAGGTSALYTKGVISRVAAVAYSGVPADAGQASANAGQTVRLEGSGLSVGTDVLMLWTDYQGTVTSLKLNPVQASVDGTSAQLQLPDHVNGVLRLQVLGSASQVVVQIVPTIDRIDVQDRIALFGSGYVEGAGTYTFTGTSHTDTLIDAADPGEVVNVWVDGGQNNSVYIRRAAVNTFGAGAVTVRTAGGTSAAYQLNVIRVDVAGTNLGDVAVDAQGKLWVSDQANPTKLLKIEPSTGQVLQTITMNAEVSGFGNQYMANYAGLQVLGQAMTLGGVAVAAGSLLVTTGYYYNNPPAVVAVNPASGAVIARLELAPGQYLTAGVYDAVTGRLFVLQHQSNKLAEVNAATGEQIAAFDLPGNIQSWAGLAIDPVTGNLWIGGSNTGSVVHEVKRDGTLVRTVNLQSQGINQSEISGLVFDAQGKLLVASTQGVVYKVDTNVDGVGTPRATLTQVIAVAADGTAANGGQASANVGEVIELRGTNFSASTSVVFNTRDINGVNRVVAVNPLLVSEDGTRLQVRVPDLATTGDIRVVNRGEQNLGFTNFGGGWVDSIHRKVQVNFTAAGASTVIRFTDGGLEDVSNESWGLDNVRLRTAGGGATVFEDNFEAGAKANWSNATTDNSNATFTRFSGRFNNTSQTLNLSGLSAGQSYTLEFDLYAIDSWEGLDIGSGPDRFQVVVDGATLLNETLSNHPENGVQTLNASAGLRLQIVPKLVSVSSSRPGEEGYFYLNGTGFMEGATTVTVGGVVQQDGITNDNPIEIDGSNSRLGTVAPRTLDGPIRVTTEGGWSQIDGVAVGEQPVAVYTGIVAVASAGVPADAGKPSAVTGQTIQLTGQGMSSSTLVQFRGIDDTGREGTLTRTGSWNGTVLSVVVPALAKSGPVVVVGSNASYELQVVPTIDSVGGVVAAGNTIVIEGTGYAQSELVVSIDGRTAGDVVRQTVVDGDGNTADQQLLTLVVPAGITAGVITVSTGGGSAVLRRAQTVTALSALNPATDVGDTTATAQNTGLGRNQSVAIGGAITTALDVDLYRVELEAGERLSVNMVNATTPNLYANLRIFNSAGVLQVAKSPYFSPGGANEALDWWAPSGGTYYIGVSGYNNATYNINTANSGNNGSYTGTYTLSLQRLAAGTTTLGVINASATSGTPTNAGVASANTGQTIVLSATAVQAGDRVVFTSIDSNGNLSETVVAPTAVDSAAGTLTVVVPNTATTGMVRLERERAGLLLQIVPTISDLIVSTGGSYNGAGLSLVGTGFAEGQGAVWFDNQRLADISRSYGQDVTSSSTRINLGVANGMPTGPIRVSTVGGTSGGLPDRAERGERHGHAGCGG